MKDTCKSAGIYRERVQPSPKSLKIVSYNKNTKRMYHWPLASLEENPAYNHGKTIFYAVLIENVTKIITDIS